MYIIYTYMYMYIYVHIYIYIYIHTHKPFLNSSCHHYLFFITCIAFSSQGKLSQKDKLFKLLGVLVSVSILK